MTWADFDDLEHRHAPALLHDSGRRVTDQSFGVRLQGALALAPGALYSWRVRVWTSSDEAEGCASTWGTGQFVTALFDGFSAPPIWLPPAPGHNPAAAPPGGWRPTYAYFRHVESLRGDVLAATVFVTATQSGIEEKLLSAYRLYVNRRVVSVGPGRGEAAVRGPKPTPYDTVDVTSAVVHAASVDSGRVVFAAQCYHHDGAAGANFLLQAHIAYRGARAVHVVRSDETWLAYNATGVYNPMGDLGGDVTGTDRQPREYINGTEAAMVTGWKDLQFRPGAGWAPAVTRPPLLRPPVAKATLPIDFTPGLRPTQLLKVCDRNRDTMSPKMCDVFSHKTNAHLFLVPSASCPPPPPPRRRHVRRPYLVGDTCQAQGQGPGNVVG